MQFSFVWRTLVLLLISNHEWSLILIEIRTRPYECMGREKLILKSICMRCTQRQSRKLLKEKYWKVQKLLASLKTKQYCTEAGNTRSYYHADTCRALMKDRGRGESTGRTGLFLWKRPDQLFLPQNTIKQKL